MKKNNSNLLIKIRSLKKKKITLTVLFSLTVSVLLMACEKPKTTNEETLVWKCIPATDISITLTFNSKESNKVYVTTTPDPLSRLYLIRTSGIAEYIMHGDTIHPLIDGKYDCGGGYPYYLLTKLSKDSINISYGGFLPAIPIIKEYLFIRQSN